MGKRLRYFTKENIRWQKSIWKDATSSVTRKREIKTTMRYNYTPIRMAKTKKKREREKKRKRK